MLVLIDTGGRRSMPARFLQRELATAAAFIEKYTISIHPPVVTEPPQLVRNT
jgi:hypothetical protein